MAVRTLIIGMGLLNLFTACKNDRTGSWKDYGGSPDQSKYIEAEDITRENVKQLQVAWSYPTGDHLFYQWNPIVVDTIMYVMAKNNSLVALNAQTGKEIWIHSNLRGLTTKGINYWESKDRKDRRLIFQMNSYLQEIDAMSGKTILNFGDSGVVDLKPGMQQDPNTIVRTHSNTPGKMYDNLLLLGAQTGEGYVAAAGYLRAYDVVTGKLVWTFHTIPLPGEYGYDTWPKEAYKYIGGVNTWGEISVDEKRGIAYFPLGSPTYDYYGGDRAGANLFGNCLLAVDARTGKRRWHFQTVHHDLWDYDLSAAPQLITVNHEGKPVDAVAVAGKNGFLFVFDRVTGVPLWPIEERPVPASDIPGEQAWPTQPFPTVVPPFNRQKITSADIDPYFLSDSERVSWKTRLDTIPNGLYVPVSEKRETIALPGAVGGASWGSTASIPGKGIVFVRSIDLPSVYGKVSKRKPPGKEALEASVKEATGQGIYLNTCQACHGAERQGVVGPELVTLKNRINLKDFRHIISNGRGEMPAFANLGESEINNLYHFLTTGATVLRTAAGEVIPAVATGPIVDSGGAPKGRRPRPILGAAGAAGRLDNGYGFPYPEGTVTNPDRYYIPAGWGLGYPYIVSPPWSSLAAYDLNTGKIKWQVPVGTDEEAEKQGANNTGIFAAQRQGMIVTSSGLLFITGRDGRIYAFDTDNGQKLWSYQLPASTDGIPSMYELNGKHYLVICATSPIKFGRTKPQNADSASGASKEIQGAYIVFAIPDKK